MKTVSRHMASNAWSKVRVGDALQLINGRAFKPSEWKEKGLPIVRIQNLNNPKAPFNYYEGDLPEKFLLNSGDLLFAWSGTPGTSFGAHIWRGGKAWLNQHIFKVLFDETEFDKRFLRFAINQNLTVYIQAAHGAAGLAHITKGKFEQSELLKPSLDEQRTIVAEIEKQFSRLDEAVASLKRTKANLKRYKAAVLKATVDGKLTENWRKQHPNVEPASKLLERILAERRAKWSGRGKYKEPVAPNPVELPILPKGWIWATLDQVAAPEPNSITDGPFGSNLKTEHYKETGPRVIRLQNIGDGVFVNEEAHISEEHFAHLQKHRVFAGDLVIAALGVDPPRSCLIPQSVGHAIVKADCIRFKPHKDVGAQYLNGVLNSQPTRQRAKSIVHGVGRPRLNLGEIKAIVVPVPPTVEQQVIVAEVESRLSVIVEIEAAVEANLTRVERLWQSVLESAFSGRLVDSNKTTANSDRQIVSTDSATISPL